MPSQSTFNFSYPLAAAKTQPFAGEDLMNNFFSAPSPFPFASCALEHLNTSKKQYSGFHSKESDGLALFPMGDGAATSEVFNNGTALDGIFSLGDWIVLEDEPAPSLPPSFFVEPFTSTSEAVEPPVKVASPEKAALSSGCVLNLIQLPSKEGAHPIPSSSTTGAGLVKETPDFYFDHVESSIGLPCFVNDKFGRARISLGVTAPHLARLYSRSAIKQADSVPHEHVRLSDVNSYADVGDIHNAVDLSLTVEESYEVQSVYAPLPHTVPVSPFPVPARASSSSDLAKPVNPPKALALPAKRNPRKRSQVDEDDEDFVGGPALKKRKADSTTRASRAGIHCHLCGKWCDNANNMRRHMRKDGHGSTKLPCLVKTCSGRFTREDSLKRHLENKHQWEFPNPVWDAWMVKQKEDLAEQAKSILTY